MSLGSAWGGSGSLRLGFLSASRWAWCLACLASNSCCSAWRCSAALLSQGQQALHLLAQLGLDLVRMRPGQRLLLARVGTYLGAVQCDVAQLEQPHLPRQHRHLHEPHFDFLQKVPPQHWHNADPNFPL